MSDMRTDDQIADLFARANPVPIDATTTDVREDTLVELAPTASPPDGDEPVELDHVADRTDDMPRRTWALIAGVAAAVALVVSLLVVSTSDRGEQIPADEPEPVPTLPDPDSPGRSEAELAVATAYWEAVEAGDPDTVAAVVDPVYLQEGCCVPQGRAETLAGQFDWYEAVGGQWTFDECVIGDSSDIECTAAVSTAYSRAIGAEVTATFTMRFSDAGISAILDRLGLFGSQWSPMVFEPFAHWVETNHPGDARVMFDFDTDLNSEILQLFEINTERFVEAFDGFEEWVRTNHPEDADVMWSGDGVIAERAVLFQINTRRFIEAHAS